MNRGRSRQVSQTAIARNASRERRASVLRPSPSTSPDSDDSMYDDDPTQSLEDQVHVAYAHDDIHTAKILLLRLKGIEVTDDNDPRIAEVQDEDFDFCFAPHGTLVLDEYHEKAIREQQRLETERLEQYRRIERLRMCEQKWAREKRRLREERMQVLRSREMKRFEEDERRRRRDQEQKIRRQQTEARLFQLRTTRVRGERRVLSYTLQQPHTRRPPPPNSSSSDSDSDEERERASLLYDFMIVPPAPRPRRQKPASPPPPPAKSNQRHHLPTPTFDDSCSVSFTEVLQSMQGPLFPLSNEERASRNQSPSISKARSRSHSKGPTTAMSHSQVRRHKESELLQSLLIHPGFSEEDRRRSKGKDKAVVSPRVYSACSECRRSPSASSTDLSSPTSPTSSIASSSSSSSTGSRPSSWLSFGSSASVSSAGTSPSTSPSRRSSWFKTSPSTSSPSRRASWLSTALTSPPRSIKRQTSFDEKRCRCQHDHLTPISITDSPLFFESDDFTTALPSPEPYSTSLESVLGGVRIRRSTPPSSPSNMTASLLNNVSQTVSASVSSLLGLAKGFQQAYVTAAMFSVAAACDGDRWEEREVVYEYDRVKGVRVVQVVRAEGDVSARGGRRPESINEKAKARKTKRRMKPVGHRVSPKDVAKFLDVKSCCSCVAAEGSGQENHGAATGDLQKASNVVAEGCQHAAPASTPTVKAGKYVEIPLGSPYSPHQTPSTVLPNPLPYKLHFQPIPAPTRSPFRFNAFSHIHTTYRQDGASETPDYSLNLNSCSRGTVRGISWRIRSVGNPAHLRLRALQNVLWQNGLTWEGRGREMSIGGGRDRVVGVAYEGVGPSKLSRGPVPVTV